MNVNDKIIMKPLKRSISWLHRRVNLSTKRNTHYETLGVSTNATHNEIKSAYYNLTLKYHPDKNRSEAAKEKFQEISHAYDVIGKYETRKQYDRSISVKHRSTYTTKEKTVHRHPADNTFHYPKGKIYNFDAWVKEHYTNTFEKQMELKEKEKEGKRLEQDHNNIGSLIILGSLMLLTLSAMLHNFAMEQKKSVASSEQDR